jgi:hypothetical protein
VVPVAGGEPLASFLLPPGAAFVRWAPDGRAVTYIDRSRGYNLTRQPIAGGEPESLTSFDTGRLLRYAWSPDGTAVALHRTLGQQDNLWILRPGSEEPRPVTDFKSGSIWSLHWAVDSKRLIFTHGTASQDVVLITGAGGPS